MLINLLNLPDIEQEIISYLIRTDKASLDILKKAMPTTSPKEVEEAVYRLETQKYIKAISTKGSIEYQISLQEPVEQKSLFTLSILSKLSKLDTLKDLQQFALFKKLPKKALETIAKKIEKRQYARNEVIVWQGEESNYLFLIKSGIISITRLLPGSKKTQVLAYLKAGDTLGDVGILENQSRSATATALSTVDVLIINRTHFLDLLKKHTTVAIELARLLGRKLLATNTRLGTSSTQPQLILIFRLDKQCGRTLIGCSLAMQLKQITQYPTVYTEYPTAYNLPQRFQFDPTLNTYTHNTGFDIIIPNLAPNLPVMVKATLMLDDLLNKYKNVIVSLPETIEKGVVYMLERASQIILITSAKNQNYQKLADLRNNLKKYLHPEKTGLVTIVSRINAQQQTASLPDHFDFELPFLANIPPISTWSLSNKAFNTALIEPITTITKTIVNNMGRTHQIAVYIPTTIDVNESFDTTPYIEKTLAFLGKCFGGATSGTAQGVWNSDEVGLVNEKVYIVRSFITDTDMNTHLDTVLAYVEGLKKELKQEAMAVEVDQKLILI